ncbi:outer membrane protein assembly factor BamD [Geoalkalibacter halelectricus]|uniref:Outer membrane protein assembly factor BamD n=1 Tax=Geoalkalibacter halelectricus TaxID=2847045 RepID=A0ABY5ZPF3_9BACT|nr:outer membrane protein assembly factor BamD [Geoalkalibacter halelectricus]MDO3379228.1 outer membrane protein assembly factor BamD [Geoalkalibacter halelectricus]UWZ80986.1 outer membrane protein assembly factor BamD [Geoalkalibacter halelectricus]
MRKKIILPATLLLLSLGVLACAPKQPAAPRTAEQYLREGEDFFERRLYDRAIESWQKVRDSYYSPELNVIAELKIAEAYFLAERYVEAATAYEDFLRQHPDHARTPDVLYHLGLSYYRQMLSIDRDQTATQNALATFELLTTKYPNDPRREEVGFLMQRCRDHLAASELYVGRFYFRTGQYEAAVRRLERLFVKYPNFFERDEAYFYLGRAYLEANQREQAVDTFNTLFREFPQSQFVPRAQRIIARTY